MKMKRFDGEERTYKPSRHLVCNSSGLLNSNLRIIKRGYYEKSQSLQ